MADEAAQSAPSKIAVSPAVNAPRCIVVSTPRTDPAVIKPCSTAAKRGRNRMVAAPKSAPKASPTSPSTNTDTASATPPRSRRAPKDSSTSEAIAVVGQRHRQHAATAYQHPHHPSRAEAFPPQYEHLF